MLHRKGFQEKLDELQGDVIRLGTLALDMARQAVEATYLRNASLAEAVIAADDAVDASERAIYTKAVIVVVEEAPVAADLRLLVATLGVVGEIERAADQTVKLARRSLKLGNRFPDKYRSEFAGLGDLARRQFGDAMRLYGSYDRGLGDSVIAGDEEIDRAYTSVRRGILEDMRSVDGDLEPYFLTLEAFHALEHFADHAVEMARRLRMLYER
ncbi:MAG: PhoU domain-containing protein [Fimbriimonadaceae bacterium]|nr:PhoU domain-containing protein [Fimbriimonadaceae bacterium]